ncbi:uncharacterized protein IL334_002144 [Kwoniella shivajii]|uniref:Uncharacterized protein n=1 Tax=Kwoniella shivajii TaxID=564305 RepID=A0ABZ1CTW6_9TREE|nr:hypothetical protein IL334_002144 [Kwoniella shivajii]
MSSFNAPTFATSNGNGGLAGDHLPSDTIKSHPITPETSVHITKDDTIPSPVGAHADTSGPSSNGFDQNVNTASGDMIFANMPRSKAPKDRTTVFYDIPKTGYYWSTTDYRRDEEANSAAYDFNTKVRDKARDYWEAAETLEKSGDIDDNTRRNLTKKAVQDIFTEGAPFNLVHVYENTYEQLSEIFDAKSTVNATKPARSVLVIAVNTRLSGDQSSTSPDTIRQYRTFTPVASSKGYKTHSISPSTVEGRRQRCEVMADDFNRKVNSKRHRKSKGWTDIAARLTDRYTTYEKYSIVGVDQTLVNRPSDKPFNPLKSIGAIPDTKIVKRSNRSDKGQDPGLSRLAEDAEECEVHD